MSEANTAEDKKQSSTEDKKAMQQRFAASLGEACWLLSRSPLHKNNLFMSDIEWLLLPPLQLNQYRLFHDSNDKPVAIVVWAFLDEEAGKQIQEGQIKLPQSKWRCGKDMWLMDVIAPFGGVEAIVKKFRETLKEGVQFSMLRVDSKGNKEVVTSDKLEEPVA